MKGLAAAKAELWLSGAEWGSQIDNARSLIGRILTQNRYPLLLNGPLLAEFPQKRDQQKRRPVPAAGQRRQARPKTLK
jgi:hypothetical protein